MLVMETCERLVPDLLQCECTLEVHTFFKQRQIHNDCLDYNCVRMQ